MSQILSLGIESYAFFKSIKVTITLDLVFKHSSWREVKLNIYKIHDLPLRNPY